MRAVWMRCLRCVHVLEGSIWSCSTFGYICVVLFFWRYVVHIMHPIRNCWSFERHAVLRMCHLIYYLISLVVHFHLYFHNISHYIYFISCNDYILIRLFMPIFPHFIVRFSHLSPTANSTSLSNKHFYFLFSS